MTNEEILKWWEFDPYIQSFFIELLSRREKVRELKRQGKNYITAKSEYKDILKLCLSDLKVADIEKTIPEDIIEEMRNEIFTIFEQE